MRTIIAGGRDFNDWILLEDSIAVDLPWEITTVISGGAKGADFLGEVWAERHRTPLKIFPADWKTHGKSAGPIRNVEMASEADALVAFWDGKSRGTSHMITVAKDMGLKVHIVRYEKGS